MSKYLNSRHDGRNLKKEVRGVGKSIRSLTNKAKPIYPKQQQQPVILKQLLWKAKVVQTIPAVPILTLPHQQRNRSQERKDVDEDRDDEAEYAMEQRQVRKNLADAAEALAVAKNKVFAQKPLSPESFAGGSSSQETHSGSEDKVVYLRFCGQLPSIQPSPECRKSKEQEEGGEKRNGKRSAISVVPSDEVTQKRSELEMVTSTRDKQRQKYKLRQKQKRAVAKKHKGFHRQKQEKELLYRESTGYTQNDQNAMLGILYPPTNLASEMDQSVSRVVISQLKDVVPFIVVGDVACPVVVGSYKSLVSAKQHNDSVASSGVAAMDYEFARLDHYKVMHVQNRESFVVDNSGFDAASSYDFLKHRFCEIQRCTSFMFY